MKRIRLFCASVLIVLAAVGGSLTPAQSASAAYWWETVYGPIYGEGLSLGEGACYGHDPHWIDQGWGWTCPYWKGLMFLKYCQWNPYGHHHEVVVWKANAWINWNVWGGKSFDRTSPWASYLIDRSPWAQAYCMGPHPQYF